MSAILILLKPTSPIHHDHNPRAHSNPQQPLNQNPRITTQNNLSIENNVRNDRSHKANPGQIAIE